MALTLAEAEKLSNDVLLPYGGIEYYIQRAGRVRGLTAFLTEARSAGTLIFKVKPRANPPECTAP